MNLEKVKLWTVEIESTANSHLWRGVFMQEPTFYTVLSAILMKIDELERGLKNKTNNESDDEWLYAQKDRTQHILELWKSIQDKPCISPARKMVRVAGTRIGEYRTTTSEVFIQEPNDV